MSNIQKQHKISPAIAWLTIQKFIIFYCPLDGEHTRAIEVTFLPCSEILIKNPEKYFLIMLYIMLLAGGMWTTISVCISAYCPVNYFVHLIPFIGIFLLTRFNSMLHLPDKWRLDFWLCGRAGLEQPYVYILLLTVSVTVLTSICCWLFYKKVKWRVLNE